MGDIFLDKKKKKKWVSAIQVRLEYNTEWQNVPHLETVTYTVVP